MPAPSKEKVKKLTKGEQRKQKEIELHKKLGMDTTKEQVVEARKKASKV